MNTTEFETETETETAEIAAATVTSAAAAGTVAGPDALAAFLAEAAPTAGGLDALPLQGLSLAGCVDAVVAWERVVRHGQAGLTRALGALVRWEGDEGLFGESEVCAALAWAPATAQHRLSEAQTLTRLFPATVQRLSEGGVSMEQARSLEQLTGGLEAAAARAVEAHVLPRMPGRSNAATRQAIRRAAQRADPEAAAKRHERQRERRRVELRAEDEGMATLEFYLPADVAQMAMHALTTLAQCAKRRIKDSSDKRTLDQRRADMLPAVLHAAATGGAFGAGKPTVSARVNVVVGIETLLRLSHEPGYLEGYGPICPEQTRRIANANAARWRFLLTSSDGTLVEASTRSYTPTAAIKRIIALKFTTCAFPHCSMTADRCDLDHGVAYHKGGPTAVANLAPLCRRHHREKSAGLWRIERHGDTIAWISTRTGRRYTATATRYQPTPTNN